MRKTCQFCGTEFQAARKDKKFCSDGCRVKSANAVRAERKRQAGTITGSSLERVSALTRQLHLEDSPEAAVARVLAGKLDRGEESIAALAAASRELRALLDVMRKAGVREVDHVDELSKRRAARRAAAGVR